MMRLLILLLTVSFSIYGQNYNLNKQWEYLGPDDKPDSPTNSSASGVGPIEFIRVYKNEPKNLLAGSLSGGLFFSENGGDNWLNSGSDSWPFSGCGWADFYPENKHTWFAYSNISDNNGKPGIMGEHGGIYRTINSGTDWQLIGDYTQVGGTKQHTIYGTRFHPENPKILFIVSDETIFYTNDCLAEKVVWNRIPNLMGMFYDMDFIGETVFVSHFFHGKWNVVQFDLSNYSSTKILSPIQKINDEIRTITFEPFGENLLVLIDYAKNSDVLYEYTVETGELRKLIGNQQINFGSGHTLAVSPHDKNEFLIGSSITLKKYDYANLKEQKMGGGYHVDVEFVSYDPIDTSKIYMACHGGVYISYDKGKTWQNKSNGLGVAEVMGMAVSESDPNQIVIGTFHDGSSLLADFNKNGNYFWRTINGGDGLIPLANPTNAAIVYTSTQYTGGGIFYSNDSGKTSTNVHSINSFATSGWELSAVLHPKDPDILYFNFKKINQEEKGNIDIARTSNPSQKKSAEVITNFSKTHGLKTYLIYGIFNNPYFPDHLYAYVLHTDKDIDGKDITNFRLFRSEIARDSASKVIDSWYELEVPINNWIADVEGDPSNPNQIYISYSSARDVSINPDLSTGLVYALKYNKKSKGLKREIDISENLPNSIAGRFNLVCLSENKKELFVATRTGVYYGNSKTLKGRADWQKIGQGLPHCKIFGLHYHQEKKILTVGLFGRGVWRYRLLD